MSLTTARYTQSSRPVNLSPMTASDTVPGELPDPHTTAGKIADLERRRYEAVHAGSAAAMEKQHAKGKLTARERIACCSTRGRSPSSTSWPGTARTTSASSATAPTATGS